MTPIEQENYQKSLLTEKKIDKFKNSVCYIPSHTVFGNQWKKENFTSISDEALFIIREREKERLKNG